MDFNDLLRSLSALFFYDCAFRKMEAYGKAVYLAFFVFQTLVPSASFSHSLYPRLIVKLLQLWEGN